MKGHIIDRGDGVFDLIIYLGKQLTGHDASGKPVFKKKQKWERFKGTRRGAQRRLNDLLAEVGSGNYVEPAVEPLAVYLKRWLVGIKPSVGEKTFNQYERWVDRHICRVLGGIPLGKLTADQIRAGYAQLRESGRLDGKGGLSEQSMLHVHRILKEALKQAVLDGILTRNPVETVRTPKPESKEMAILDEANTAKLLEAAKSWGLYVAVVLAATTGMRRGEILGLRWQDVDLEAGTLTVAKAVEDAPEVRRLKQPKTKKSKRTIIITPSTVQALREWRAEQFERRQQMGECYHDNGLVVCRLDGGILDPPGFSARFHEFIREVGLPPIRFHDLRHTHASQLLDQGAQVTEVSNRLGHSLTSTTLNIYGHRMPGAEQRMMEQFEERLRRARNGE